MDVNLLFGPGFKQAGSPLMEMKLIFSLIETGALPASFLGITNLSFLFYPPPDANLRYIKGTKNRGLYKEIRVLFALFFREIS